MRIWKKMATLLAVALMLPTVAPAAAQETEDNYFCRKDAAFHHTVGEGIADTFDIDYEQVMEWFCEDGHGFGQILLALQTAAVHDEADADELLDRRADGEGWGQI